MKIEFLVVSNIIGGDYNHFSRISRLFGQEVTYFWDSKYEKYVLKPTSLVESLLLKILTSFTKFFRGRYPNNYFNLFIKYFLPSFHKLEGNEGFKIISTGFVPIPKGKNIIAYVLTPSRAFTIDFEHYSNTFRSRSYFLYIVFLVSRYIYTFNYLRAIKKNPIRLLSNSQTVRKRLLKYYGIESKVVYPSIDSKDFKYESSEKYFLYVSRFSQYKRQDFAIRAFEIFFKNHDQFRMILAGPTPKEKDGTEYVQQLNSYVSEKNIPVSFKFDMSKIDLTQLYGRCYAFLFCTIEEDFGLAPLEAMASGKPVISVNEGGPTETILDGITGFLIKDEIEMAEKMNLLAENLQLTIELGKNGREHVLKNYDDQVFVEKIKMEINSLANAVNKPQ